jgi:hypothetical protein
MSRKAKTSPAAAQSMESVMPESRMERARKVISRSGLEVGDIRDFYLARNGYLPSEKGGL